MTAAPPFVVKPVNWRASQEAIRAIRTRVFVEEQRIPEELEWDEEDEHSYHVLVYASDGSPVGTGRLLRDGRIGRMAVLKEWRGRGAGSALMKYLLWLAAKMGFDEVKLHAQVRAAGFYAKHGFRAEGEEFMEAGIPHVVMSRTTTDADGRES
ncbi:MAG TPA: GNAT family N-acetyltransferase [Burkholderiales bacterium]|nr:GNAT family N-acetyltransferase [Burkholderiales bacterium]